MRVMMHRALLDVLSALAVQFDASDIPTRSAASVDISIAARRVKRGICCGNLDCNLTGEGLGIDTCSKLRILIDCTPGCRSAI